MDRSQTPRRLNIQSSSQLSESATAERIKEAYKVPFPWDGTTTPDVYEWFAALSKSRNTLPEYVFMSTLPVIGMLIGPKTKLEVSPVYHEKGNLYLCILGEPGSGKSQAFHTSTMCVKKLEDEKISGALLQSSWSRNGLLASIEESQGKALIAYEEMDTFFSSVVRGQREGSSDRSFFCELFDGCAQNIIRATNDGKRQMRQLAEMSVGISGFHQPHPFLAEHGELHVRRDGFLERFLIACPRPKRLLPDELDEAIQCLLAYPDDMKDLTALYTTISEHHEDGVTYLLSPESHALYRDLMTDKAHEFNSAIEMTQHSTSAGRSRIRATGSKDIRLTLKLSVVLHVLQQALKVRTSADVHHFDVNIDRRTFERAICLMSYFANQKEILFFREEKPADDAEEGAYDTLSTEDSLKRRILTYHGLTVATRNFSKKLTPAMRPKSTELLAIMKELQEEEAGKVVTVRRTTLFVKSCLVPDATLRKYKVEREDFMRACGEKDHTLSASQVASFAEDEAVKEATENYQARRT